MGLAPANPTRFFFFQCSSCRRAISILQKLCALAATSTGPRLALQWMILALQCDDTLLLAPSILWTLLLAQDSPSNEWYSQSDLKTTHSNYNWFETPCLRLPCTITTMNPKHKIMTNNAHNHQQKTEMTTRATCNRQSRWHIWNHIKSNQIKQNQPKWRKTIQIIQNQKKHSKTAVHSKGPLQLRLLQKDHQKS